MKKILILILITSNLIFSQESEINKLIELGSEEFQNNNIIKANELFEKALKIDSLNKDVLFNLAATELKLNNKSKACKLWQKGYKLKDYGARELVLKYCGQIEYSEFMFKEDVDSEPKFIFKDKELPINIDSKLNPKLTSLFLKESKKSKVIKNYKNQKILLIFNINKNGKFEIKAIKDKPDELKFEIERIFNEIVTFIPSKYKGLNTEYWGGYAFPIYFN
ncbi:hypothetical protein [uncultured Lutibacter sp.]|uniref:tetratricopeptide repeat protein n=1 Tax=uncultured Lutibacter sp. TaxID=437739 RepID=UPI00260CC715|nr:hypothetical protein [uncultured Lutibacter sp.]